MEAINTFFRFLLDNSVALYKRAIGLAFVFIIFWMVDGILGLSDFFFIKQKVEAISSLNTLIADDATDSVTKDILVADLAYIAKRKSLKSQFSSFINENILLANTSNTPTINNTLSIQTNVFALFLSSTGLFALLLVDYYADYYRYYRSKYSRKKILSVVYYIALPALLLMALFINNLPIIPTQYTNGRIESNIIYQFVLAICLIIAAIVLSRKNKIDIYPKIDKHFDPVEKSEKPLQPKDK